MHPSFDICDACILIAHYKAPSALNVINVKKIPYMSVFFLAFQWLFSVVEGFSVFKAASSANS